MILKSRPWHISAPLASLYCRWLPSHNKYQCCDAGGRFNNFKSGLICLWDWPRSHVRRRGGVGAYKDGPFVAAVSDGLLKPGGTAHFIIQPFVIWSEGGVGEMSISLRELAWRWNSFIIRQNERVWMFAFAAVLCEAFMLTRSRSHQCLLFMWGKFLGCLVSETYSDQVKQTRFPWFCLEFLW